jgi:hypothetical protein
MARRRKWLWIGVVFFVLIGLVCLWQWLINRGSAPALVVSHQTTWITEPLNKDGTVNYVAYVDAIARQGVTPENNAAIKYLQATGPKGLKQDNPAAVQRVLDALPLKLPADGKYFVPLDDFVATQSGKTGKDLSKARDEAKKQADETRKQSWDAQDYPLLDQWVTANETPLNVLIEASKLDRFYVPPASDADPPSLSDAGMQLQFSRMTDLVKCLAARASRSVKKGDLDAAWADVHALYRFGRLQQTGDRPPIRAICGMLAGERGGDVTELMAAHDAVSRAQAAAMLKMLGELSPPILNTHKDIERVRLETLDICQQVYRMYHTAGETGFDCNFGMMRINSFSDECLKALEAGDYPAVMRGLQGATDKSAEDLKYWANHKPLFVLERFFGNRSKKDRMMTLVLLAPTCFLDYRGFYRREVGCRTQTALVEVAMLLVVYRADTGQFPDSLAALSPKYLPRLPDDPYSNKPLLYRRDPDGGCIVYSVGENMKDDGGNARDVIVHLAPKKSK